MADVSSWSYCAAVVLALIMFSSSSSFSSVDIDEATIATGNRLQLSGGRACDEIYVVGEGETLHTISDKCGDPFIVENNPHIQDSDDVFPGLVIKIIPTKSS